MWVCFFFVLIWNLAKTWALFWKFPLKMEKFEKKALNFLTNEDLSFELLFSFKDIWPNSGYIAHIVRL